MEGEGREKVLKRIKEVEIQLFRMERESRVGGSKMGVTRKGK